MAGRGDAVLLDHPLVAPGDDVELIVPPLEGRHDLVQQGLHGILTRVLPRRSELRRLHPSGRSIQTISPAKTAGTEDSVGSGEEAPSGVDLGAAVGGREAFRDPSLVF